MLYTKLMQDSAEDLAIKRYKKLRNALIVFAIVISLGCAFGISQAQKAGDDAQSALRQFKKDSEVRRSAQCANQERQYQQEVKKVSGTYGYLNSLTPDEIKSTLNQTIIRTLPETEQTAHLAKPPAFCAEPGIGLREPIAIFPKHQDFSHLLIKK